MIKRGLFKLKSRSKVILITENQHTKTLSFFSIENKKHYF